MDYACIIFMLVFYAYIYVLGSSTAFARVGVMDKMPEKYSPIDELTFRECGSVSN